MNTPKTTAVTFIHGQILSNDEIDRIQHCLDNYDLAIVFIGSANRAPSPTNPFSYADRRKMILSVFPLGNSQRLRIEPIPDMPHFDYEWARSAMVLTNGVIATASYTRMLKDKDVTVVCQKDKLPKYRCMFPQFKCDGLEIGENYSGSALRDVFFNGGLHVGKGGTVNGAVYDIVKELSEERSNYFESLRLEHKEFQKRTDKLEKLTVIFCGGHVALGKGYDSRAAHLYGLPEAIHGQEGVLHGPNAYINVPKAAIRLGGGDETAYIPKRDGSGDAYLVSTVVLAPNGDGSLPEIKPKGTFTDLNWKSLPTLKKFNGITVGEQLSIIELMRRKHYANY